MPYPELELTLPYITEGIPGIGGEIKKKPKHFIVEEIPLYEPEGSGQHLYVNITKINMTTREVQEKLADLFELPTHHIGHAGLKDKNAVTTQNFSILLQNEIRSIEKLEKLIEKNIDVKVNWAKYHRNKLRTGHLLGNRFKITIVDLEQDFKDIYEIADKITKKIHMIGLPNFYGKQRTGEEGDNIISGWEILNGKKWITNKWLRRYLISCYQSYLYNRYLTLRIERGLFKRILNGDIAKKHDTGGIFLVDNPANAQKRFDDKEISFTAPIYGYKMTGALHDSRKIEDEVLNRSSVSMEHFRKHRVTGTRRLGRILPNITFKKAAEGIELEFKLPKGSFATILLSEYMKKKSD
jgi:tRNA pseudouridine13 synthase